MFEVSCALFQKRVRDKHLSVWRYAGGGREFMFNSRSEKKNVVVSRKEFERSPDQPQIDDVLIKSQHEIWFTERPKDEICELSSFQYGARISQMRFIHVDIWEVRNLHPERISKEEIWIRCIENVEIVASASIILRIFPTKCGLRWYLDLSTPNSRILASIHILLSMDDVIDIFTIPIYDEDGKILIIANLTFQKL